MAAKKGASRRTLKSDLAKVDAHSIRSGEYRDVLLLAEGLLSRASLPAKARLDALHIAAAALGGMEYLLTWNYTHIANPAFRPRIEALIRSYGHEPPVICTPQELIEV